MQSHLSFEGHRFVFLPNHCGRIVHFFYHREVCLVSTNVIEDNCSFQGFVVFVLESSLAVKHLHRRFGWAHRKPLLTLFFVKQQKGGTPFPQGRTKQWCFLFHFCAHFFFKLTCGFTWQCALMYWGEGDVWWGMCKGDALSMGWTRLLRLSIICIRVVHVI